MDKRLKSFIKFIKSRRNGDSQSLIAKKSGLSQSKVSRVFSGDAEPSFSEADLILRALGSSSMEFEEHLGGAKVIARDEVAERLGNIESQMEALQSSRVASPSTDYDAGEIERLKAENSRLKGELKDAINLEHLNKIHPMLPKVLRGRIETLKTAIKVKQAMTPTEQEDTIITIFPEKKSSS